MIARKIRESCASIENAATREKTIISGLRTAMRMIIWYVFCRFVTSVVRRVTMLAVENLSMFENEKVCTL